MTYRYKLGGVYIYKVTPKKYSGKLDVSELHGGGMGMGTKGSSGAQGLFSAVTGLKGSSSTLGSSTGNGLASGKRTKSMPPNSNSNAVTVSGTQFVWGADNDNSQATGFGAAPTGGFSTSKAMSAMEARMAAPAGGLTSVGSAASKSKKTNRVAVSAVNTKSLFSSLPQN